MRLVTRTFSTSVKRLKTIPVLFSNWFENKQWSVRPYQRLMVKAFAEHRSTLLIAPTGAGKTLSGFLPTLIDLHKHPQTGLHTIYISPLKALTQDIHRNLQQPIDDMSLSITVGARTGDTSAYQRQQQRKKPPNILLITPESLMLMLSYADAPRIFGQVKAIIVDEAHSFAFTKRGDFTALALAFSMTKFACVQNPKPLYSSPFISFIFFPVSCPRCMLIN